MPVLDTYLRAADAVILTARVSALRAVGPEASRSDRLDTLYAALEAATEREVWARLGARDDDERRVMTGGIVAAHALHRRLVLAEDEYADDVGDAVQMLWSNDLTRRVATYKRLGPSTAGYQGEARRSLGSLLRHLPGDRQATAAAGQLARHVIKDGHPGMRHAWYATFGLNLLAAHPAAKIAAVALIRAGVPKIDVHRVGGISRQTLDNWTGRTPTTSSASE